jgi:O-antigen/teichoic acid export membrane protein
VSRAEDGRGGGVRSAGGLAGAAARRLRELLRADGSLVGHSSVLFLATLLGQVLGFGVQILLARRLGIESYGLYVYAFAWISFLALLATMGGDRVLVRFLGEYGASGRGGLFRGVLAWSLATALATSLLVGACFYALQLALDPPATAERSGVLLWTVATLPLVVVAGLAESALRGCGAHGAATWPSRVLRPLLFAAFVLALAWGEGPHDARWALALNAAAILLAALPSLAALWPRLPPRPARPESRLPTGAWLAASLVLGLNTLALHLNSQIDMLVLGLLGDEAALGAYGAVTRIATMVGVASVAVIAVIQPMFAAARARGEDLTGLVRTGARLVFLASAGAGGVVFVFAGDLLAIFGEQFGEGATALRILAAGQVATSLVSLAGPLLAMTGRERDATVVMALGCVANLLLTLLLVPPLGIAGAALGSALSALGWNVALFAVAKRRLGVAAFPAAWPRRRGATTPAPGAA